MGVGGQRYALATWPPGKTQYPLYRRLDGPQGWSGWVQKILPPTGFDPRTVQPITSRYTDCTIPAHALCKDYTYYSIRGFHPNKYDLRIWSFTSRALLSHYHHNHILAVRPIYTHSFSSRLSFLCHPYQLMFNTLQYNLSQTASHVTSNLNAFPAFQKLLKWKMRWVPPT
jgi:hypothetical protein